VNGVPDIKTALFFKNKGDIMKVKVVRKRFLLGEKELAVRGEIVRSVEKTVVRLASAD